ncbi:acetyl-CoA acetyltransferase [Enterococcus faecalis]|uniref:Thiolase family protein n=1 Tax=Enterococcus faecalis RP2S-4 TaxID=1244145 RepID=A0ABC9TJL0_ENTFL|nr:acetyl-CoA acetyltransferase [Enterococcus faecalis]EPI09085.1 thiolase family protein [Enterococcus faecalis RP2S-4]
MSKAYVLGGAQTDFSRNFTKENKSVIALLREVIDDGLKASGLTLTDIEQLNKNQRVVCTVSNFAGDLFFNQGHIGALLTKVSPAFYGVPSARYEAACASGSVALDAGITKIKAEDCDVVLVIGFELMKTVSSKLAGDYLGRAAYYETEAQEIDFPFPKLFGRLAEETVQKYSLDTETYYEALAKIVTKNYANAKKNRFAQTRGWFMDLEQANQRGTAYNPFVGGGLANSDCSQITDGAACVVLASEKFVREKGLNVKKIPVVKGVGQTVAPLEFEKKLKDSKNNPYILPWTHEAVRQAYQQANVTVADIDVFETHDCFSSSEYLAISAFEITGPGEELMAVLSGRTAFEGDKPINPSGGLIGGGHPVGASGVRMFLDIYKQVTNKCEAYQIRGAQNGMMLNLGGTATTNYAFIIGLET